MMAYEECFNPCFRGSRSRSYSMCSFQRAQSGFQSLFSWKSLSIQNQTTITVTQEQVSILVFVEVALDLFYS